LESPVFFKLSFIDLRTAFSLRAATPGGARWAQALVEGLLKERKPPQLKFLAETIP
jgi:hypothetical protein